MNNPKRELIRDGEGTEPLVQEPGNILQQSKEEYRAQEVIQNVAAMEPNVGGALAETTEEYRASEVITNAALESDVIRALTDYSEMRVMLVGKSGVGKSSFVNSLLQANGAPVGRARPETNKVTEYDVVLHTHCDETIIKVYDTPGFGANKKENEKIIKEIRKNCEIVDVIFLCIRMDDQLRVEDRQTIDLLAKKFDAKFWEKCLIVFTRANMVQGLGQHKCKSKEEYLKSVRDELKEDIQKVFENTNTRTKLPPFVLAGAPDFTPEGRMIPNINVSNDQEEIDWLPPVVDELFKSGCSDNAKAILLKSGWKKWARVSAGTGVGMPVGAALGGGVVAVGIATLALPPLGEIAIVIGAAIIVASLVSGGASVGFGGKAAVDKTKTDEQVDAALNKMKK